MNLVLREKTKESLEAVLPITVIVMLLSITIAPMDIGVMALFLAGAALLVVGMGLFQLGAEMSMTPLGEGVGVQLSQTRKMGLIIIISFVLGVVITIAEPDLQVLAYQVPSIPNWNLILSVALGVGVFLAIAVMRIIFKIRLANLLMVLYVFMMLLSVFVPNDFLAVAFDSGGVTTGPITVPFIMAMGVGLTSMRSDKNATDDSFGLVALCSVGPILAVMLLGIVYNPEQAAYVGVEIATVITMRDVVMELVHALPHYLKEVMVSILPVVAVFFIFQLFTKRFSRRNFIRILIGFVYTYVGLVLFLCGVNVGFAPVGSLLGGLLAQSKYPWQLIPVGMLVGWYIVKAEPSVQVLNRQVEEVTNGAIPAKAMYNCLSIGVAVSVGLAMLRILTGLNIYWLVIPGYAIALIMSRFVPEIFVGIAFDSGGVASGPMTSTFLLPLAIGACEAVGGNIMADAFGVVAMVAMTPLIAVQAMGLVYKFRQKNTGVELDGIEEEIIDLEEV